MPGECYSYGLWGAALQTRLVGLLLLGGPNTRKPVRKSLSAYRFYVYRYRGKYGCGVEMMDKEGPELWT